MASLMASLFRCVEKVQTFLSESHVPGTFFQGVNLFKWQLLRLTQYGAVSAGMSTTECHRSPVMASLFRYDAVVFADIDLELMPIAQHDPRWVGAVWARALSQIAHHPRLKLLADPDRYSPINGGFMLIQPSADLYEQGIHTLRRCARPPFATPAPTGVRTKDRHTRAHDTPGHMTHPARGNL